MLALIGWTGFRLVSIKGKCFTVGELELSHLGLEKSHWKFIALQSKLSISLHCSGSAETWKKPAAASGKSKTFEIGCCFQVSRFRILSELFLFALQRTMCDILQPFLDILWVKDPFYCTTWNRWAVKVNSEQNAIFKTRFFKLLINIWLQFVYYLFKIFLQFVYNFLTIC